jgi:hypothetical protein
MTCSKGYEVNWADGTCKLTSENEEMSPIAKSTSATTTSAVAVSASAAIATSALKANSPMGLWSLFNQLQMLILLLLVDDFVPVDVNDYI